MSPAKALARFAADVEKKLNITVSIGLSCNKFLAKIASDLDKPRGFAVLGGGEAQAFLAPKPVSFIFGVGKVSAARYARDGFHRIADLQRASEIELMRRYGEEGRRLARLARGIDSREVSAERETKSVSSETTFEHDIADFRSLERILWSLTEEVSARLKTKELAGATVTLKLKTADFKIRTRARSLETPTQLARRIFAAARGLLERETDGTRYRLLGVGVSAIVDCATRPIRPISSTAARRSPNMPSTACAPASARMPWSGDWRLRGRRKRSRHCEEPTGPREVARPDDKLRDDPPSLAPRATVGLSPPKRGARRWKQSRSRAVRLDCFALRARNDEVLRAGLRVFDFQRSQLPGDDEIVVVERQRARNAVLVKLEADRVSRRFARRNSPPCPSRNS